MSETELMWAATLVHYPNPKPPVIRTDDIRIENVLSEDIMAYLEEHRDTIDRVTLYPPGKWSGLTEFTDPDDLPWIV